MVIKYIRWLPALLAVLLILSFYYFHLHIPIRIWDEAIYANNAIEMAASGNYLTLTNNDLPSLYNTKPPLVIWISSIAIGIFGIHEWVIRLPSMMALGFTAFALLYFLRRHGSGIIAQGATVLILLTSPGYLSPHVAATGDLDAMLTFWTTAFALVVFDICLSRTGSFQTKKLLLAGLFFLGGFFTKSTAMLLPLPGLILFIILAGKGGIFRKGILYVIIASVIFLIAAYYLMVDHLVPGYFNAVWFSEVSRIYSNIMPWHNHPWHFYFTNLGDRFWPWLLLLPFFIPFLWMKPSPLKQIMLWSLLYAAVYLLIISIPAVKLEWYDAPVYPMLAMALGTGIEKAAHQIHSRYGRPGRVLFLLIILSVAGTSYYRVISASRSIAWDPLEREGLFVRNSMERHPFSQTTVIMEVEHQEHLDQLNFYRKKYRAEKKAVIGVAANSLQLAAGDTIIVCQDAQKKALLQQFEADTLFFEGDCLLLRLSLRKQVKAAPGAKEIEMPPLNKTRGQRL